MIVSAEADRRAGSRTCSLWYVAGWLGKRERSPQWLADYVQKLVERQNFPRPLPDYRAGRLVEKVTGSSRWLTQAVDAWFDGLLPPGIAEGAGDDAARARVAARWAGTLDQRAAALAGGEQEAA